MTQDKLGGEVYTPLFPFDSSIPKEIQFLCCDQPRTNLFWLVEPRIDTEGLDAARDNPKALSIYEHMDRVTRKHLQGLPLAFLAYWDGVMAKIPDGETPALTQGWPWDYRKTIGIRAAQAQRRLTVISEVENVVTVQFNRRKAG